MLIFDLGVQQVAGQSSGLPDAAFVRGAGSTDCTIYALTSNSRVKIPLRITSVPTQVLASVVELHDDRGRNFKHSQNVDITTASASIWGTKQPFDFSTPGITEYAVFPYDVAADARSLRLVSSTFQCSPRAKRKPARSLESRRHTIGTATVGKGTFSSTVTIPATTAPGND